MLTRLIRALADALDRIGATIVALCIMGGWFIEQIDKPAARLGVALGLALLLVGAYTKCRIDHKEAGK